MLRSINNAFNDCLNVTWPSRVVNHNNTAMNTKKQVNKRLTSDNDIKYSRITKKKKKARNLVNVIIIRFPVDVVITFLIEFDSELLLD